MNIPSIVGIKVAALVAAVAFAAGGTAAWKVQGWRYAAKELQAQQAAAKAKDRKIEVAHTASQGYELDLGTNGARYEAVIFEIEKVVDRPVYRNVCIDDDGLRALNRQIRRAPAASQSGDALPGSARDSWQFW